MSVSDVKQFSGSLHGLMRYYVLHLLSRKKYYGYEIIETIRDKTGGTWNISSGALYPLLKRMEKDGYIRSGYEKGKTVYEITEEGSLALSRVKDKLEALFRNWDNYRKLLEDFVGKEELARLSATGYQHQFYLFRDTVDSLSKEEALELMNRVIYELDFQKAWLNQKVNEVNKR